MRAPLRLGVEISSEQHDTGAHEELTIISIITITMLLQTYRSRHLEIEEVHTGYTTEQNRNRRREVLRNVVRIVNDERNNDTAGCLKANGRPHHPVVTNEEPSLCYHFSVLPDNTQE